MFSFHRIHISQRRPHGQKLEVGIRVWNKSVGASWDRGGFGPFLFFKDGGREPMPYKSIVHKGKGKSSKIFLSASKNWRRGGLPFTLLSGFLWEPQPDKHPQPLGVCPFLRVKPVLGYPKPKPPPPPRRNLRWGFSFSQPPRAGLTWASRSSGTSASWRWAPRLRGAPRASRPEPEPPGVIGPARRGGGGAIL